jgi:hypothetical protein
MSLTKVAVKDNPINTVIAANEKILIKFRSPQESDEPIEFIGILHLGFPGLAFEVGI